MSAVQISKYGIILLFCFFISLSNAQSEIGVNDNEVLIGSSSALGGHASFLGTQLTQGSLAYINEVNARGGINGRKIKMICLDDKYDPPKAVANTNELIKQKHVFALFDYVGTPTARAIVEIVNREEVPLLGLFTGAEFLYNPISPYIICVRASYFDETDKIVDYWVKQGRTKIGVFYQDDAFGLAVLAGTKNALEKRNLKISVTATFKRGMMPSSDMIQKMVNAAPDGVVMVGTYSPLAFFVRESVKNGLENTSFHTVSFVGSEAFIEKLLEYKSGIEKNVFVTQVVPSPNDLRHPTVREFVSLYGKHYPDEKPNYVALEGFVNAKILSEALRRCGNEITRQKFITTLENMSDYDVGIGLPASVSNQNHSFFKEVYISEIKNGSFEIIGSNEF